MTDTDTTTADDPETAAVSGAAGRRTKSVADIRDVYADYAGWFARLDRLDRLFTGRYRRRAFATARGRVLDVACGTGVNFPYVPASAEIVGIDVSPEMLRGAREQLSDLGRDGSLYEMDAQEMSFEDDSFDTVISSLSTCTFPDPVAALREMARVCKPDGKILLLEHGRSDVGPVARFQDWRADAHYENLGCRWNQDPVALVASADLPILSARSWVLGIITAIETRPA